MRLTKHTNYAIRMMMYCDAHEGLCKIGSIASFYNISEYFLIKILQGLTSAGLIESIRGRNGGIRLAKPADQIKVGDIVRVTEENFSLAECFDADSQCPLETSCGYNFALKEALDAFLEVLDRYSLADLTQSQHNLRVLVKLDSAKDIPFNLN